MQAALTPQTLSNLTTAAQDVCAGAADGERAACQNHPGRLLTSARKLREAQIAVGGGIAEAEELLGRARALLQEALDKETRSRMEADAARGRGERLVAKSLRRTERRAGRTLERAHELMERALTRRHGCEILADELGRAAAALENEGHAHLASKCSVMAGMTVRVDIPGIRRAGGAAWGPPALQRDKRGVRRDHNLPETPRVEAVSAPARELATMLIHQLLGDDQVLPVPPDLAVCDEAFPEA